MWSRRILSFNNAPPAIRALALLTALLASLGGCLPKSINRDESAKEVIKQDPSFHSVLEKYRALTSRIDTYERELAVKRTTIEQNVQRLRQELQVATAAVKRKIDEIKQLMDPQRQELAVALSLADEQLKTTHSQRTSIARRIVQLRKAIKAPARGTSSQTLAQYQAQYEEAAAEAQRLDREIALIKDHIHLLKLKARLIEF